MFKTYCPMLAMSPHSSDCVFSPREMDNIKSRASEKRTLRAEDAFEIKEPNLIQKKCDKRWVIGASVAVVLAAVIIVVVYFTVLKEDPGESSKFSNV